VRRIEISQRLSGIDQLHRSQQRQRASGKSAFALKADMSIVEKHVSNRFRRFDLTEHQIG
jgi:hypothetical protein